MKSSSTIDFLRSFFRSRSAGTFGRHLTKSRGDDSMEAPAGAMGSTDTRGAAWPESGM